MSLSCGVSKALAGSFSPEMCGAVALRTSFRRPSSAVGAGFLLAVGCSPVVLAPSLPSARSLTVVVESLGVCQSFSLSRPLLQLLLRPFLRQFWLHHLPLLLNQCLRWWCLGVSWISPLFTTSGWSVSEVVQVSSAPSLPSLAIEAWCVMHAPLSIDSPATLTPPPLVDRPSAASPIPRSFAEAFVGSFSGGGPPLGVKSPSSHCGNPALYFSKSDIDSFSKPFALSLVSKFVIARPLVLHS